MYPTPGLIDFYLQEKHQKIKISISNVEVKRISWQPMELWKETKPHVSNKGKLNTLTLLHEI